MKTAIFYAVEGWTFLECVYYCIVTLTTVGFGDFVPGIDDKDHHPLYRGFVVVWLLFGLAWVALTINDISDNFKTKTQKSEDEKTTQNDDKDLDTNDRNPQLSRLELTNFNSYKNTESMTISNTTCSITPITH
ncbi:hypothetical protein KUTeg_014193 [Tegillarca granosa]|uniref:Potassium channel domain-containing protein n=1 Tax=Tegillarca granosa TaxID=220873 RepID=A0ABQ9EVW4_TEGGR|nr:hypothetical protein KUTeg_014193 [Tegillarca granosa]